MIVNLFTSLFVCAKGTGGIL